jgi:hypothetical protein
MRTPTSGVARTLVSFIHYVKFYEIDLSPRPVLLVAAALTWLVLTALVLGFGDTEWSGPTWVWVGSLLLPLIALAVGLARSDAPAQPHYRANESILQRLKSIGPSQRELALGFARESFRSEPGGQIILSHAFNAEEMSNPGRDWTLVLPKRSTQIDAILSNLHPHRRDLVAHGRQSFLRAALANKALVNEEKIAFAADFPNQLQSVEVFRSTYFCGQCSVDRALQDVVVQEGGQEHVTTEGGERLSSLLDDDWAHLPDFSRAAYSISLHIGIEVIAVSADGVLRVPIQSARTQYNQNMRIPLASGSVDWDDGQRAPSLKSLLRSAASRELAEEWGASTPDVRRRLLASRLEPVGYFRDPLRLGKPQFVAIGRFDCSDAELAADVSEVYKRNNKGSETSSGSRTLFNVQCLDDVHAAMQNILTSVGPYRDSVPLLGAATCIRGLIERVPDRMAKLLELAK